MIKGIIFDMDGTMIDNMMVHHRAWQRTLADQGLKLTLEEVKEQIHGINSEILERIFGDRFTPEQRRQISAQKEAAYREIFLPELKLVPGLHDFLNKLKSANVPMAIGTAAPRENVEYVMANLKLQPYFMGVFDAQSVSRGKPDPEIFEKAAASMNLSTDQCLIFEDSVTGAEAAKRANAKSIIITTTHIEEEFHHFDNIIRFIQDFEQMDLDILR
jgi:beta-phosphoglucomutase